MGFFLAVGLIVLPLFLLVCIQIIRQSSFKTKVAGKILEIILGFFIFLSLATGLYLITQV
jgi:hypothetical protein